MSDTQISSSSSSSESDYEEEGATGMAYAYEPLADVESEETPLPCTDEPGSESANSYMLRLPKRLREVYSRCLPRVQTNASLDW